MMTYQNEFEAEAGDPLEVRDTPAWVSLPLMLVRILGMVTLAAYAYWVLPKLWGSLDGFYEMEMAALGGVAAFLGIGVETPVGAAVITGAAVGVIVACILSAVYITVVMPKWVRKIKREWKWVWRNLSSDSWLDKAFGFFGFVLTLVESVFFVLVTVTTVVVVWVNVKTLIPVPTP